MLEVETDWQLHEKPMQAMSLLSVPATMTLGMSAPRQAAVQRTVGTAAQQSSACQQVSNMPTALRAHSSSTALARVQSPLAPDMTALLSV